MKNSYMKNLLAEKYIGEIVNVTTDRPLGTKHPKFDMVYEVNYGYVPDTKAPDGEEIDAYILGVDKPVNKFTGVCIAVVHRLDDDDDKLIVVPEGVTFSKNKILELVNFQEQHFKSEVIVKDN